MADGAAGVSDDAASPAEVRARAYDGLSPHDLARRLEVASLAVFDVVGSTQDVAHRLAAAGAPAGTLVLADRQQSGRGRGGRLWSSPPGSGIWLTWIVRTADASALEVLSLRAGLALAAALDACTDAPVRVKWPNDLHVGGGKLAGVLVESRWRDGAPEWVAIGVGCNVRRPDGVPAAAGLRPEVERLDALARIVHALREATAVAGSLTAEELDRWAGRDAAAGRRIAEPVPGVAVGIAPSGALRIRRADGEVVERRAGSLVYAAEQG